MKKSLVALAVLAASGASFAQSSVTLYGVADIWLGNVKTDGAAGTSVTQLTSGGVSTSVWGMKGSEDLGGGLKANFKLEQSVAFDTGAASGFNREAWVGLSGGFGTVRFGKVSSAYNDPEGAAGAIFGSGTLGPIGIAFESDIQEDARPVNTIYYAAPTMGGFDASVSYSLDEKKTGGSELKSLGLIYAAGPLFAGLGYQTQKAYGSSTEVQLTQVNVTYDLAVVKLLGALGHVGNSYGVAGDKVNEWQIGVDVPVSAAFAVSTGYAKSDYTFAAGGPDDKVTVFSVGGAYSLSKRTTAYVGFATSKLDSTDVKTDRYAVGIKHTF